MRAQWEAAVRQLDTPVASPYALSFYTLPRHHELMKLIGPGVAKAAANVLPDGDGPTGGCVALAQGKMGVDDCGTICALANTGEHRARHSKSCRYHCSSAPSDV